MKKDNQQINCKKIFLLKRNVTNNLYTSSTFLLNILLLFCILLHGISIFGIVGICLIYLGVIIGITIGIAFTIIILYELYEYEKKIKKKYKSQKRPKKEN